MSQLYQPNFPGNPEGMSKTELVEWFLQELQTISDTLLAETGVRDFTPYSGEPAKFGEGSVVFFNEVAAGEVNGVFLPGLHVYRNGRWRQLAEV